MTETKPFGDTHPLVDLLNAGDKGTAEYDLIRVDHGTPGQPWDVALYLHRESGRFSLVTIDEHESAVAEFGTLSAAVVEYDEALTTYQDFGA